MCNFFSLLSNGCGKIYYFDYSIRKEIIKGNLNYETDSHTSIVDCFKLNEDVLNKWEYNPLTQELKLDQLNCYRKDEKQVLEKCRNLDFKKIVPELIIKPIINPFDLQNGAIVKEDIALLRKWAFIWNSVWTSAWASVWDYVRASVGDYVGVSVWDYVSASAGDYVEAMIWNSVWAYSWDPVRAYVSSFFNLSEWRYIDCKIGENPFQPCIDLWEKGLVPSFDGKIWRLHGVQGEILWEGEIK